MGLVNEYEIISDFWSVLPFMYFVIIIVTLIAYMIIILGRFKKIKNVLETQAVKRRGEITKSFFGYPNLNFNYYSNQVNIYIKPGSRYSPPTTELIIKLSSPVPHSISMYKEGIPSKIGKRLGAEDVEVGFEGFDKDVMIKSSDEYFARSILTSDVQDLVLKIVNKHKAYISLGDDVLKISVKKIIYDESEYDELIDAGLKIVDKLQERK